MQTYLQDRADPATKHTVTETSCVIGDGSLRSMLEVRKRKRTNSLTHTAGFAGINLARISTQRGQEWTLLQDAVKITVKYLPFNFACVRYSLCGLNG